MGSRPRSFTRFLPRAVLAGATVGLGLLCARGWAPAPPAAAEVSRSAALAKDLQDLFAGVAEEVRPAVVFISSTRTIPVPEADAEIEQFFQGRRATRQRSLGSGVIIDPRGFVL